MRRWDGRAWTADVRPLPEWLRTLRLSPGPTGRSGHSSRRLWAASAGLLALGGLLMVIMAGADADDQGRIGDEVFLRQANERCARADEEVVQPNSEPVAADSEAHRIEALAGVWQQMVADLRRLEVARPDQAKVDQWLGAWDHWAELGHDYARALAAEDHAAAQEVLDQSRRSKHEINRFAYVNGMNACIFR